MSQVFDKYEKLGAYHYDWYDDPNYAWYKECVDRCVKFCKGITIDVGCGDGLVVEKLKSGGCMGIDIDDKAIELAKSKGLSVSKQDLDNGLVIIIMGGFDYMCCLNVIEHLKSPYTIKKFVEKARKGAIIITDMPTENKGRYHEHEYTKKELLDTFAEFKPKYFVINSTEFGKPIQFHGVEIKK